MKKRYLLSAIVLGASALSLSAHACYNPVEQKNLFNLKSAVPLVEVKTGDLLRLELTYPIIPAHLKAKVVGSSSHREIVAPVAESTFYLENPDVRPIVGVGGKFIYFKAHRAGAATIRVNLIDRDGKVTRTVEQYVEVSEAPLYRCR